MSAVYRQSPEPRVDWFRVIADLARKGVGRRTIARRIHVAQGTAQGWKQGAEPRHSDGERLIALWCETTGQPREALPMRDPFDWR